MCVCVCVCVSYISINQSNSRRDSMDETEMGPWSVVSVSTLS